MQSLESATPNKPTILIVGPAGTGKTTTMCRFKIPTKLTYIIDADKNLAGPRKVLTAEKRDISYLRFDHLDVDETGKAVPPLMRYLRLANLLNLAVADDSVGVIGITSTTSLVPILMGEVLRQTNRPDGAQFAIQDWGKYSYLWSFVINTLRACNKVVLIDGHTQTEKNELDQIIRHVLAIPGRTGELLPMSVTDFWRASVEYKLINNTNTPVYTIHTIQDNRNPNVKTSLPLPHSFEANQTNIDQITANL